MTTTSPASDVPSAAPRRADGGSMRSLRTVRGSRRITAALCAALALLAGPGAAGAQQADETRDGRLEGYKEVVALTGGNAVTGTWMLFFGLAAVGCAVMFKDAKRSHGD